MPGRRLGERNIQLPMLLHGSPMYLADDAARRHIK
jgi:hypothetical protein